MTQWLDQEIKVVGVVDPDANDAAAYSTAAIDMRYFDQVMFITQVGTMASTSTVDFKVQECATSGGSYTDITGKANTQLTQAGTDSDKQVITTVKASEMTPGHRYLKGVMTVGTAASDCGLIALGARSRYEENTADLSTVDEIVH